MNRLANPVCNKSLFLRLFTFSVFVLLTGFGHPSAARALDQEIGFVEEYALSENRAETLKKLVPGTELYYYYHSLHYLTTEQLDKAEALLVVWKKRNGETSQFKLIRNRLALLKYGDNPQATLDFLKRELGINLAHQRRIPEAQRDLPTRLDPSRIALERRIKSVLNSRLTDRFTDAGLELLANSSLTRAQRRHLLQRLSVPDFPNLVKLIATDLKQRDSGGFGSINIHRSLTTAQLDELVTLMPKLANNNAFIDTYLTKLHPSNDVNWRESPAEQRAYLDRLWKYAKPLSDKFNSLKACILFRQLELDRDEGVYDKRKFLTYLRLPRQIGYVNPELLDAVKTKSHFVQLGANFTNQTRLRPVGNDEELVRDYLQHFLADANDDSQFRPYIRTKFLETQLATAKILRGLGNAEKWASLLSPSVYQSLVERTDLDFARTNQRQFNIDEEVELELYTKNIDKLIVKVFQINAFNFYRKNGAEIDTNINLDGLVPNFEKAFEYDDAPALRIKRKFELPEIDRSGVFVVDFIGNGKSSRALIRKGRLSMIGNTTIAGHLFKVMNQDGKHLKDAKLWISNRRYQANEDGLILVPFSNAPGRRNAIITHGDFSCLQSFQQQSETYQLNAAALIDRESLLRSNEANILIRPTLLLSGHPVTTELLKDIEVLITTENLEGITATKLVKDLELPTNAETTCSFVVPPRLKKVTLSLTCKVKNLSQNRKDSLSFSKSFQVNEIDKTDEIQDVHLAPTNSGYTLEILGKSGESRAKQAVRVSVRLRGFKEHINFDLQSDKNGQVDLGDLSHVDHIKVKLTGGSERSWSLNEHYQTYYGTIHGLTNQEITVPAPADISTLGRGDVSLFEIRNGHYTTDRFSAVKYKNGALKIANLPAGDYRLRLKKSNQNITLRITEGTAFDNRLIGKFRQLEARGGVPIHFSKVAVNKTELQIDVGQTNEWTRVHVFGTRYLPRFSSFGQLGSIRDLEPSMFTPAIRRSVYMAGRKIGDEYQYILDRKYVQKYPGNLLERPTLLLNPWELRATQNQKESLAAGGKFGSVGTDADRKADGQRSQGRSGSASSDYSNLDFLRNSNLLAANIKPDKNGKVRLKRELLANHQHIRVVLVDAYSTSERSLNLPLEKRQIRDLRMVNAMDPNKHFSQLKDVDILKKGSQFEIEDILSAKFRHYDDIGDIFQLLNTINSGALDEFEFLLNWEDADDEKKRDLYSRHACHELNFFLLKKDPEFFQSVVLKHLTFKRDKTFMDRWFLKENLDEFFDPWKYRELNVVERILLSQRYEEFQPDINRNIRETYLLSPTPREQFGILFDQGITTSLSDEETLSLYYEQNEARKRLRSSLKKAKPGSSRDQVKFDAFSDESEDDDISTSDFAAVAGIQQQAQSINLVQQPLVTKGEMLGRIISPGGGGGAGRGGGGFKNNTPGTFFRAESRSKNMPDGSVLNYSVQVPATENLPIEKMLELREMSKQLYRRLGETKEWVENNYWKLPPTQKTSDRVKANQFWRDYADHRDGPFLSANFAEASGNLTEMMFALAVIDLPFKGPEHKFVYDDAQMKLTAAGPMIALHQQVRPTQFDRQNTTILVSENFFQKNDRYRYENGVQFDKFISEKFSAHTLYGAQVVITNPTSTPQAIDLLLQIPQGAVVAGNSQETKTIPKSLAAFSTQTFEYYFYFPTAGKFSHFPAHVSSEEKVLAVADNVEFNVVDQPVELDKSSWAYVSQNGSNDEVIEYINKNNVLRLPLREIAFRMKDKAFFERTIETLKNRYQYDHTLWSYSVLHNRPELIREYLSHAESFVNKCGQNFVCDLLDSNPIERRWYFHSEFWPLINARVHQVGQKRKILNPEFHNQYHKLLLVLSSERELADDDHLVVCYYMLLQDRIDEALEHFGKVDVDKIEAEMQYDYCDAYLDFYRESPESAVAKATKWADYPVVHWRKRFQEILAQAEEIRGGETTVIDDTNNKQQQEDLANQAPSFEFEIEARRVSVAYQNLTDLTVNYYEMDIELLFSRRPFAQEELDGFSMIKPNLVKTVKLPKSESGKQAKFEFELPAELENKNVLVEILGGDQTKSQPYFANSINVQMIETYGQLRVTDKKTGRPLPKSYVKVYSRSNGQVKFHKDGYTDLRGRFDYVSQSNNSINGVEKYSILIMHPEKGSLMRQANPPQE